MTSSAYTVAEVYHRKNRINHRILFGNIERYVRLDWQRRLAVFRPGSVFGYERWLANRYGTQSWSIVVGQATPVGPITRVDGIHPGLDVWSRTVGKTRVKRLFEAIDAMRAAGILPEQLSERRWRALHLANHQAQPLGPILEGWVC